MRCGLDLCRSRFGRSLCHSLVTSLCRTRANVKLLQAFAEQQHSSIFADCCREKAEVCNQKAEVDEGAGEGAEPLPTDFFNDLQCFW